MSDSLSDVTMSYNSGIKSERGVSTPPKFIRELLTRVLDGETASDILAGLTPQNKGYVGEALLRVLVLLGIHPTNTSSFVIPYQSVPTTRRLEAISDISDRLYILNTGLIISGQNKIDVSWRDGNLIAVCSCKIGKIRVKSIYDLEITAMLTEFTESGGYTECGKPVFRESIVPYVLVDNKYEVLRLAEKSKASNKVSKDNLNPLDIDDLNRMCAVLLERIDRCASKDFESILSHLLSDQKPALRTRLHQKLICLKVKRLIDTGEKTILIGALPRSGKTYMGAFIAKHFKKILIITTRPGETRTQWNKVFKEHREFSTYKVDDLNSSSSTEIALSNKKDVNMVAVASIQFFKMDKRDPLIGLEWDLVILDEVHEGGSTEISNKMLDTYIGSKSIRIMMTATYTKSVEYYNIPAKCCIFWDLEDVRLMRSWGEPHVFDRLCEKYGASDMTITRDETYKSGETDASIRLCYDNAPCLSILTTIMQPTIYDELRVATGSPDNVYGFSMRSLLMPTEDGKTFQKQKEVDTFLALISGSNKTKDYKKGDMSMYARITRWWKTIGHRNYDEFITQIWFLPSGVGQLLEHVKSAMISRINANPVLKHFATLTLDSGMDDISKNVTRAVEDAKGNGKRGLIILTGNVGSLGVSLPEVDVGFLLHDKESADMNYQQMMRVLTEMVNKKCGIIVDFNVWRVLNTLNTYATSRCGQAGKSSGKRIYFCVSNLVDVDPDLWQCPDSPEEFPQEKITEELENQWRKILEQTRTSLNTLAMKTIDLGEDQKILNENFTHSSFDESRKKNTLEVNPDQEKLSSGIETRSKETDSDEESQETKETEETDDSSKDEKNVNINDILSRLIPFIALLTDCEHDLGKAMKKINETEIIRDAFNDFLKYVYKTKHETPLDIICKLIQKHYEKMDDARENIEYFSGVLKLMIDNPQELIAFLGEHLKPKDIEKKQNGEVFTPPFLIGQKFDKLTEVDPSIWKNPSLKFLDPANGIGNYPALAFHRLMEGLEEAIPDPAERKKHILENMLYMCELNKLNVGVSNKIFDPEGIYKLNIHCGSFLELDTMKKWGVEKFDVIMGNPPYNASGTKASGNTIWQSFVDKSLLLLKREGYLVFIHPPGWRKPNTDRGKFFGLFEKMVKDNQMKYLSIHGIKDGLQTFKCGTRYDWYIIQQTPSTEDTIVKDEKRVEVSVNMREFEWLPNYMIDIVMRLLAKEGEEKCPIIYNRSNYGSDKSYTSRTKTDEFKYPVVHTIPQTGVRYLYSKTCENGHYGISKVIFGDNGLNDVIIDMEGKYATSENSMSIKVDSIKEATEIKNTLLNTQFKEIINACIIGNFRIDWRLFTYFKKDFWREFLKDSVIDDVDSLSSSSSSSSLPPVVEVDTDGIMPQPDYKKMKVADLKQLCKHRKIKGATGKRKNELIAMLMNS